MARFTLDEDLSDDLAPELRRRGHDAVHVREAGRAGLIDARQFAAAVGDDRILVTANLRDVQLLHEAWLVWTPLLAPERPASHPGVVVMPNPNAMSALTMAAVLDDLLGVDDRQATTLRNRCVQYHVGHGWLDHSPVC